MKQKIFTLFLALLASVGMMNAETIERVNIGDLYYNLDTDNQTAEVTYKSFSSNTYNTDWSIETANIPPSIIYEGITYKVSNIGKNAFQNCTNLITIEIPKIFSIGMNAFSNCSSLTSVTIPKSLISLGKNVFAGCSNLSSINIEDGNPTYDSRDNCNAIILTSTNTLVAGCKNTIIPNSITTIGDYAFSSCNSLISIEIPNNVTSISTGAFYNCSSLTSIKIPNGVTSIAYLAFSDCTNLTSVEIPNSITSIEDMAFQNCSNLTSVEIPNTVTSIGKAAFTNCSSLTSIMIPNGVTSIGERAFTRCSSLTSISVESGNPMYDSRDNCNAIIETVTNTLLAGCQNTIIPNSITTIGKEAFNGSSHLTSIEIPNSVTSIGGYAFSSCSSLTSIEIPNSITSIETSTFSGCSSLTSIEIPNSVTSIGDNAFSMCKGLTTVVIPSSVLTIGNYAFYACKGLTSVYNYATTPQTITNGVFKEAKTSTCILYVPYTSIQAYQAADVWKNFSNIQVIPGTEPCITASGTCGKPEPTGLTWELSCDGVLAINGTGDMYDYLNIEEAPWYQYRTSIQSVTLQEGVTDIGGKAFHDCINLTEIIIPNSVTIIAAYAFSGCSNLTSVNFPNGVVCIGINAFFKCSNLTSVTIPNTVVKIYDNAFDNCTGLTSIEIPNSVTHIGSGAFADCSSFTSITNHATTPQTIDGFVFYNVDKSIPLYVPAESVDAYKAAEEWNEFTNIQAIPGTEPAPCLLASGTCGAEGDNLTWELSCDSILTISGMGEMADYNSLSEIPWNDYRKEIKRVIVSEGVTSIGKSAFSYCGNLSSVEIGNSVIKIGDRAFYSSKLFSVTIPKNVAIIGNSAFYKCSSLTSIELSNGIRQIDEYAFAYCTALESMIIPNSVDSMGNSVFCGCTLLASVTLPEQITKISLGTFDGCTALSSITIPSGVQTIEARVFYNCTSLTTVDIPSTVTLIDGVAFGGCTGLKTFTCRATTPPTMGYNVFDRVELSAMVSTRLYVPCVSVDAYKAADLWKDFINIQAINPDDCEPSPCLIASGTCGNSITWELSCEGVLTISGNGEMPNWSSPQNGPWYEYREDITSIFIGNGVTSIGEGAFYECSGLTSVTIPSSVTSIGRVAFYYCSSLTSVTIPNSVTSIEYEAFSWCTGLMSVTIPNSVTTIGEGAFYNCSGLTSVTIPYSVTSIGSLAFYNCSGLMSVTIPNSVTTIGEFAFANCSGLTCVTCEAVTPPTLGERYDTFYGVNKSIPLYVPGQSINLYKAADQWKDFTTILPIPGTELPEYPVIFLDYNSDVLSEQSIEEGSAAEAPNVPAREGYIFKGWNVDIEHITARTFAIALYDKVGVEVTYKAEDGETIFSEHADLHFPDAPSITGKTFAGWLTENVDKNGIVLRATYTIDNPTTNDDVTVVPGSNSANVTFPFVTGAITYVLVIRDLFGHVVCKIMFNASGRLLGIAFAPNRDRSQTSAQTDNFQFTVEGLDPSTTYEYEFIAHDETDDVIETLAGSFTTTAEIPTDLSDVQGDETQCKKVVMNDQVLILRGDKTYTLTGAEVK